MTPRTLALDLSLHSTGYCTDGRCGRIATASMRGMARQAYGDPLVRVPAKQSAVVSTVDWPGSL